MLLQKVNREEMIYYSLILDSFFFSHTQEQKGGAHARTRGTTSLEIDSPTFHSCL